MMQPDPIVAEVRRVREELAARFGYDTAAIVKYMQQLDAVGDRKVIRLPPRRPDMVAAKPRDEQRVVSHRN